MLQFPTALGSTLPLQSQDWHGLLGPYLPVGSPKYPSAHSSQRLPVNMIQNFTFTTQIFNTKAFQECCLQKQASFYCIWSLSLFVTVLGLGRDRHNFPRRIVEVTISLYSPLLIFLPPASEISEKLCLSICPMKGGHNALWWGPVQSPGSAPPPPYFS